MVAGIFNLMHRKRASPSRSETIHPAKSPDSTDPRQLNEAITADMMDVDLCSGDRDVVVTTAEIVGRA
jgi:hypothetical protein